MKARTINTDSFNNRLPEVNDILYLAEVIGNLLKAQVDKKRDIHAGEKLENPRGIRKKNFQLWKIIEERPTSQNSPAD